MTYSAGRISHTPDCRPVPRQELTPAQPHLGVQEVLQIGVRVMGVQTRHWLAAAGAEVEGCLGALVATGEPAQLQAAHCWSGILLAALLTEKLT